MSEHHIGFEWSAQKAASNVRKHGVSFEEAATAFDDDFSFVQEDEAHSEDEPRSALLGYSNRNRLLFVAFTPRANRIHIIMARLATASERHVYEEESRH